MGLKFYVVASGNRAIAVPQDCRGRLGVNTELVDRCVKVRHGPLSARELPEMVKRACAARGIAYNAEIVKALNRSEIFRPRAIIQAVDAIAAGKSITESVAGRHV